MSKFEESSFYKALQDFFINADKKTFLQFLAEFYNRTEGIIDKNKIQDDLIKELRELYLEFNEKGIDENIVREKVNYFLENNVKIKDIISKLTTNTNNIKNINSQLETFENKTRETIKLTTILTDIPGFSENNDGNTNANIINNYITNTTFDYLRLVIPNGVYKVNEINLNKPNIIIEGDGTLIDCTINCNFGLIPNPCVKLRNFRLYNKNGTKTDGITLKCVRSGNIENVIIDSYTNAIHGLLYTGEHNFQHIKRVFINKIRYVNCKNFFINEMENGFADYSLGDIQITNCNGTATINHLNLKGCDGLIFSNNVCFSGSSNGDTSKAENIKIDYGNFINISNNSLFEAGKEGISISRAQNINIIGNNIPWCGQVYPSYAIKLNGGAQTGTNKFVMANISNNIIDRPTQGGINLGENIGYCNVNNNTIVGCGSQDYYYGTTPISSVFGISLSSTSSNNMCVNNNLSQNKCNDNGTNNVIINNNSAEKNYNYHNEITVNDGLTTVDVKGVTSIVFNNSAYVNITNFTNGYRGQIITLFNYNNRTGIDRESVDTKIITKEITNFKIPTKTTLTLQLGYGDKWYEIGRSF